MCSVRASLEVSGTAPGRPVERTPHVGSVKNPRLRSLGFYRASPFVPPMMGEDAMCDFRLEVLRDAKFAGCEEEFRIRAGNMPVALAVLRFNRLPIDHLVVRDLHVVVPDCRDD